jgi:hypothetical protein
VWNVHLRATLSSERTGLRVADHPNNFAQELLIPPDDKAFADRLRWRPEVTFRHRFVDDHDFGRFGIIA